MIERIQTYLDKDSLLNENGIELQVKCGTPRLIGAKYFPLLKSKKFNIEMSDDGASAIVKISTINDLINLMKAVDRDVIFEKNGDAIKIQ